MLLTLRTKPVPLHLFFAISATIVCCSSCPAYMLSLLSIFTCRYCLLSSCPWWWESRDETREREKWKRKRKRKRAKRERGLWKQQKENEKNFQQRENLLRESIYRKRIYRKLKRKSCPEPAQKEKMLRKLFMKTHRTMKNYVYEIFF